MFRLRDRENPGLWVKTLYVGIAEFTREKAQARVFPTRQREQWEGSEKYEVVPLAQDEIMAAMGAPRLPGF